jgi:hypothetical protein
MPGHYPCFLNVFLTMCGVGSLPLLRSLPLMLMFNVCSVSLPYSGSLPLFCVIQPTHKLCQVTTSALSHSFLCLIAIHDLCSVTTLVNLFFTLQFIGVPGHYPCCQYIFIRKPCRVTTPAIYSCWVPLWICSLPYIHWCAGSLPLLPVHFYP